MGSPCFRHYLQVPCHGLPASTADNLKDLCMLLKTQCGGSLNDSELSNPSSSWEEWIFAESRRRYGVPLSFPGSPSAAWYTSTENNYADLQACGSLSESSSASRPEFPPVAHQRAIDTFHFPRPSLCGRLQRSLPGNSSTTRAVCCN